MIYIGICDDEEKFRETVYEQVFKIMFRFDDVEFSYYSSGEQVIKEIDAGVFSCELLLLDIHMPERDGLETAAYIREHQVDVDIIFITVSTEHVFDGYTYQAFSYLLKPLSGNRLSNELERYMKRRENDARCLHVKVAGKKVQIYLDRVKYFVTQGRKIIACHKGNIEDISFYAKIGDLEQTLQKDEFFRCHQSYLVNARYVQSYSRTEIEVDGDLLPISRRYKELVQEYMEGGEA